MRLTLVGKSALTGLLTVFLFAAPAWADNGGDAMDRPDQLRGAKNYDTPTSVDPYEEPAFQDELTPSRDESLPGDLNALVNERGEGGGPKDNANKMRFDAMQEAAMSYGARGGLSRRTWEIRQTLDKTAGDLDRTYNFSALLIAAPSGFLIEPPIVTEAQQNVIVSGDGQEAAVTDTILKIGREARIVTAAREWRTYLERDWGKVSPPPDVLLPRTEAERLEWAKWVSMGWEAGYKQGDEIFQSDLDRLSRDYVGMVRYRTLLSQNMISAPYALQEDRGVTGGGNEMRIGDRAVSITGQSQLQARPERWQPVPR
jgi:defect in organelle trafficking protein DotC